MTDDGNVMMFSFVLLSKTYTLETWANTEFNECLTRSVSSGLKRTIPASTIRIGRFGRLILISIPVTTHTSKDKEEAS